jgi:hypothetical protein
MFVVADVGFACLAKDSCTPDAAEAPSEHEPEDASDASVDVVAEAPSDAAADSFGVADIAFADVRDGG